MCVQYFKFLDSYCVCLHTVFNYLVEVYLWRCTISELRFQLFASGFFSIFHQFSLPFSTDICIKIWLLIALCFFTSSFWISYRRCIPWDTMVVMFALGIVSCICHLLWHVVEWVSHRMIYTVHRSRTVLHSYGTQPLRTPSGVCLPWQTKPGPWTGPQGKTGFPCTFTYWFLAIHVLLDYYLNRGGVL